MTLLRTLRIKAGLSQGALAEAAGTSQPQINRLETGERKMTKEWALRLAPHLGTTPEALLFAAPEGTEAFATKPLTQVMVIGAVQAGLWREALERDVDEWYPAPIAIMPRFADYQQFGLEVLGPSMNQLYPEGSVVVCVKFIDLGRDPRPGERVVVQRRSDLGFEATVKELRRDPDGGYWLWPRSDDPRFQEPWKLPATDEMDDNDDVRIVALVVGSYRPEPYG